MTGSRDMYDLLAAVSKHAQSCHVPNRGRGLQSAGCGGRAPAVSREDSSLRWCSEHYVDFRYGWQAASSYSEYITKLWSRCSEDSVSGAWRQMFSVRRRGTAEPWPTRLRLSPSALRHQTTFINCPPKTSAASQSSTKLYNTPIAPSHPS
jgi:hypothetical protein